MKDESAAWVALIRAMVAVVTSSSVPSQLVSKGTKMLSSAATGKAPAAPMSLMYFQSAITAVSMSGLCASSRLNTVGQASYGAGLKMLLITPLLLSHTPVRIVVHDGPEIVVCPTILVAPVTLSAMRSKNPTLAGSANTLSRFVPSVPISSTRLGSVT